MTVLLVTEAGKEIFVYAFDIVMNERNPLRKINVITDFLEDWVVFLSFHLQAKQGVECD